MKLFFSFLLCFVFINTDLMAKVTVGIFNLQEIVSSTYDGKRIKKQLEDSFKKKQEILLKKQNDFKALQENAAKMVERQRKLKGVKNEEQLMKERMAKEEEFFKKEYIPVFIRAYLLYKQTTKARRCED